MQTLKRQIIWTGDPSGCVSRTKTLKRVIIWTGYLSDCIGGRTILIICFITHMPDPSTFPQVCNIPIDYRKVWLISACAYHSR